MSQKRFVSWNGTYDTVNDEDTFGLTIRDGNTPNNLLQVTFTPESSPNIQNYKYILEKSTTDVSLVPAQTFTPNLTLDTALYYQFTANLTVIATHTTSEIGTFRLTGTSIGNVLGGSSFACELITHSSGLRNHVSETDIELTVSSSNFNIVITPRNSVTLLNVLADISITSATRTV